MNPTTTLSRTRQLFDLGRHDGIRDFLPEQIRNIMQDGLLDRMFHDALVPQFRYPRAAGVEEWAGGLGQRSTFTRDGLLEPTTTPLTGDPAPASYSIEQWEVVMRQYGNATDTNLLASSASLASKFGRDVVKLAINAAQSLNLLARNELYRCYAGGRTYAVGAGAGVTTLEVASVEGFRFVLVNGEPTPVSAAAPLAITVGGTDANVVGVNTADNELTLDANTTWADGDAVVAVNAPVSFRPNARAAANTLQSGDVATFSLFRSAVARLRSQNVPTIGGAYEAHIDSTTETQLFDDPEFQTLYSGAVESPTWGDLSIGRFGGIDWVRNEEARTVEIDDATIYQPLVIGGESLMAAPLETMGDLLSELPENARASDVQLIDIDVDGGRLQVARIIRAPQDRLAQVVGSAWSWVGDWACPSDATTGDASLYKRGVLVEHR